jgi:hypothetical protein
MSRKIKYNGARVSRREHGPLSFQQMFEIDGRDETAAYVSRQSFAPTSVRV